MFLYHFQPKSIPVPVVNIELGCKSWKNSVPPRYIVMHHRYLFPDFLHMCTDATLDSSEYII